MSRSNLVEKTNLMPSVFVGHGSPMNSVEKNEFTQAMNKLGEKFKPKAILVVSAHWLENASVLQNTEEQKIIYDFYGFPEELYRLTYPTRGWGEELVNKIKDLGIEDFRLTDARGLDHGTWAVLLHMYPSTNIPTVQLSIHKRLSLKEYFQIGQKLRRLREFGVMVLGSGNIVHNLRQIDWNPTAPEKDWAVEFDQKIAEYLTNKNFDKILTIDTDEKDLFELSHPTTEHFIPLAYTIGAALPTDKVEFPCSFIQNSSISMRSVVFY